MSSDTLERILNVTLSEPSLEGVLPSLSTQHLVTHDAPHKSTANSEQPDQKRHKLDNETHSEFPTEQDIDNFLDQIHQ